jgi:DNA polymerase II small subunit/DNA polymerase delta subunit B
MGEILLTYAKDLWPIFTAFLVLGSQFYWNNKRTKSQQKLDQVEINTKQEEKESKEIENMRSLFELFQNQFKTEILSKTKDNENLTLVINELKNKVEKLSAEVKKLTNLLKDKDSEIEVIAKKCANRKKDQICVVLQHLEMKEKENPSK